MDHATKNTYPIIQGALILGSDACNQRSGDIDKEYERGKEQHDEDEDKDVVVGKKKDGLRSGNPRVRVNI